MDLLLFNFQRLNFNHKSMKIIPFENNALCGIGCTQSRLCRLSLTYKPCIPSLWNHCQPALANLTFSDILGAKGHWTELLSCHKNPANKIIINVKV